MRPRSLLVISALLIVYFTMFPFDFEFGLRSLGDVAAQFDLDVGGAYLYTDVPLNVLLFIPFGFGLCGSFASGRVRHPIPVTVVAGFAVSAAIEIVQGWALLRDPAVPDVVANGLGGAVGAAIFVRAGDAVVRRLSGATRRIASSLTARRAIVIYVGFFALVVLGSAIASRATRLDNWDLDQSLTIGNERTGDRPWVASIRSYLILDRSVSDDEARRLIADRSRVPEGVAVVAGRDFTTDEAGSPVLTWSSGATVVPAPGGVRLGPDEWLRASGDVAEVSGALATSSELTVRVELTPGSLTQSGPARIVTISHGTINRNLTLAQDGADLVVRLRTPLFGHDAVPELTVPEVFVDRTSRVVVRYDGATLTVGVDDVPARRSVEFGPGAVVLLGTYPIYIARMRINPISNRMFRVIYRALVLAPWAAVVARLETARLVRRSVSWWWRAGLGLVPAVGLEVSLGLAISTYDLRPTRVLVNIVVLCVAAWVFRVGRVPAGSASV